MRMYVCARVCLYAHVCVCVLCVCACVIVYVCLHMCVCGARGAAPCRSVLVPFFGAPFCSLRLRVCARAWGLSVNVRV